MIDNPSVAPILKENGALSDLEAVIKKYTGVDEDIVEKVRYAPVLFVPVPQVDRIYTGPRNGRDFAQSIETVKKENCVATCT